MKTVVQSFIYLLIFALSTLSTQNYFADTKSEMAAKAKAAKEKLVTPKVTENKNYPPYPNVHFKTNMGDIYFVLNGVRAPITVNNFLQYVESGHYEKTIFHRVIPGFVAQGGGHLEDFKELSTRDTIVNESGNGLSNMKGTIAMARENAPHSATAQFYINLVDNQKLDPRPDRWGYTVFGDVQYGMNLLNKVSKMPRGAGGQFSKDVPTEPLIIEKTRIMGADEEVPFDPIVYEDEEVEEDVIDEATETVQKSSSSEE